MFPLAYSVLIFGIILGTFFSVFFVVTKLKQEMKLIPIKKELRGRPRGRRYP